MRRVAVDSLRTFRVAIFQAAPGRFRALIRRHDGTPIKTRSGAFVLHLQTKLFSRAEAAASEARRIDQFGLWSRRRRTTRGLIGAWPSLSRPRSQPAPEVRSSCTLMALDLPGRRSVPFWNVTRWPSLGCRPASQIHVHKCVRAAAVDHDESKPTIDIEKLHRSSASSCGSIAMNRSKSTSRSTSPTEMIALHSTAPYGLPPRTNTRPGAAAGFASSFCVLSLWNVHRLSRHSRRSRHASVMHSRGSPQPQQQANPLVIAVLRSVTL